MIGQAYMAGCQNFEGFPFSVWLLACDDRGALDIMRAISSASRMKELMRKGKHAELPPTDQIDRWLAECDKGKRRPVAVMPIPAHRSMKLAKAVDRGIFSRLRKEPSESEFWLIVVSAGETTLVAFPKPEAVVDQSIMPI